MWSTIIIEFDARFTMPKVKFILHSYFIQLLINSDMQCMLQLIYFINFIGGSRNENGKRRHE